MDERIMFTKKEALRLGVSKGCRGNSGPTAGPKLYASLTQICEDVRYAKSRLTLQDLYYIDGCFTFGAVIRKCYLRQNCQSSKFAKSELVLSTI